MPRKPYKFQHPIKFSHKGRMLNIGLPKKLLGHKNIKTAGPSIELWLGQLKLLETQRIDGHISLNSYKAEKKQIIESLKRFLDEV